VIGKHVFITVLTGGALAAVIRAGLPAAWTPMQTAGLLLLAAGFILWTVARFELGASFAVTAQARKLITHGLYSKIRNPIYMFGSWVLAGAFLMLGRPAWLMIFIVIAPLQVWRARKEAAVLEAKFGEEYRAYRASTWF